MFALASAIFVLAVSGLVLFARHEAVQIMWWMRVHWLNVFAISAEATFALVAATALVPFVIRRLDRTSGEETARPKVGERTAMLHRVRYNWIDGVLNKSLAQAALLALDLNRRPDVLELGTRTIHHPGQAPTPLSHATSILELFDEVGGGLLILGAPGAGKTTLLLQLADELLERAECNLSQPIPVVVNLSSWGAQHECLTAWLVTELWDSYKLPQRMGKTWLAQEEFILLLDGLDEVADHHRAACAQAINAYRLEHGLAGLVVCSRTQELKELGVCLDLEEAVELQPPTEDQIDVYLRHLESTGTPLTEIRADLATDPSLWDLLRSPLMLHVIALAYHGRPAVALHAQGSLDQRRRYLWQAYVERMFEQRPLDLRCSYDQIQAIGWLGWLANAMRERDQTEFYLDRLDLSWLYPVTVSGWRADVRDVLVDRTAKIGRPVEELHWSWKSFFSRLLPTSPYKIFWWFAFPIAGFAAELRDQRTAPNEGIRRSGRYALVFGLATCLFWLLFALVAVLLRVFHIVGPPPKSMVGFLLTGLAAGLADAVGLALIAAMIFGGSAYLMHYAVLALLKRAGATPPSYGSFLEAMNERLLLRRSGGAYLFAHRMLRDYLADQATQETFVDAIGTVR